MPLNARRTRQPIDRLGRIAAAMSDVAKAHPERHDADRWIVLMVNPEGSGMSQIEGYDGMVQVIADMVEHLQAIAETGGVRIGMVAVPDAPDDASAIDGIDP